MDLQVARAEWQAALQRSKMAGIEARLAVQEINQKYREASVGRGPGPTSAQIEAADRLEQAARDARMIEEAILNRAFGVDRTYVAGSKDATVAPANRVHGRPWSQVQAGHS